MARISKDNEIMRVKNYFEYLKLGELDADLECFVAENLQYYIGRRDSKVQMTDQKITLKRQDSIFSLTFLPSYVAPVMVVVNLTNLNNRLEHEYEINFVNENYDTVTIMERRKYVSMPLPSGSCVSMSKRNVETDYISGKKRHYRKIESYIGKNKDDSYTIEEQQFYSPVDTSFVSFEIAIGEKNAKCQTKNSYQKYDGKAFTNITPTEFSQNADKYMKEKAKVFTIVHKKN